MSDHPSSLRFTHPLPYGAICHDGGVQFVVFSRRATAMRVLLYDDANDREPAEIVRFDPELNRWGDIWSVFVHGVGPGQLYHFQADGPFDPDHGLRFNGRARLIDPYAKALTGDFLAPDGDVLQPPKCVVVGDEFDWRGDRHINRGLDETVIYELHVRGFTRDESSGVEHPGTYRGLVEKIPYLKSLGITAVELMPVFEFPIKDCTGRPSRPVNYWGYDPLAFFAPHRGYAQDATPGGQVREFKEMVLALHQAGIEVVLDVVFNHTAEGNQDGPTLSFKGLANRVYYMLENGGRDYRNYSGCGNTLNGNHPIVREMIFHCLRYWVHNFHIDGFRFDLASILSRGRDGELLPNPPVIEAIAEDPLLADTKIIAEAWDAAGVYQVGSFGNRRWAEWNGRYRDEMRRFWRGDPNMIGAAATRLAGSSDLYQNGGRRPCNSINFIASHDGFTLNDLVSYSEKHNEANGEDNRDGQMENFSYNYGAEGPSQNPAVEAVRLRQIKNMTAALLLSQGVPMLLAGDECRRTQRGNNNAYCQDNPISWFDWRLVDRHAGLRRFCAALTDFRRSQPTVRRLNFLEGRAAQPGSLPDAAWFAPSGGEVDWSADSRSLICLLGAAPPTDPHRPPNHHLLMLLHAGSDARHFTLPHSVRKIDWRLLLNTAAESPDDIYPSLDGPPPPSNNVVTMEPRSMIVFVAHDTLPQR
ncbi:MAG: glycogen debranching protein GlgX [Pirellulales bacterium]|nr:glycogen debranching protein GlgX [Pirellulales bacterium]